MEQKDYSKLNRRDLAAWDISNKTQTININDFRLAIVDHFPTLTLEWSILIVLPQGLILTLRNYQYEYALPIKALTNNGKFGFKSRVHNL